jgi:hypothetical protein
LGREPIRLNCVLYSRKVTVRFCVHGIDSSGAIPQARRRLAAGVGGAEALDKAG